MNVVLELTHVLMLTVSILMEASIAHLVILVSLVMECHAVSYFNDMHFNLLCLEFCLSLY